MSALASLSSRPPGWHPPGAFWMFWYIRPEEAESISELEEDVGMLNTEFTDEESQRAVLVLWVTQEGQDEWWKGCGDMGGWSTQLKPNPPTLFDI